MSLSKYSKSKSTMKGTRSKEPDEETMVELKEAFRIFDSKNTGISFPLLKVKLMQDS